MPIIAEITIIFVSMSEENSINRLIDKRIAEGNLRELGGAQKDLIDFSSNDYLGLARSNKLKEKILNAYTELGSKNGSTGSRLLTGNTELLHETESFLAEQFGFSSSLFFSSGYMANLALFSTVPQKGDTILYDELSHACIKDGMRLSFGKRLPFKHNDLDDLKQKLEIAEGTIYVACESVYSMDGDIAPLEELANLCKLYNANLVVDEAHSTGIWGNHGQGLIHELGIQDQIFAVIHTFGKAMGIHGASISGSNELNQFLVNFARPFIYTTAPSDFEVVSVFSAFDYLREQPNRSANLFHKIELFNRSFGKQSTSAINTVEIGGNAKTKAFSKELKKQGFDVRPILNPTVKSGTERLRICIHSFNSEEEILTLADRLKRMLA